MPVLWYLTNSLTVVIIHNYRIDRLTYHMNTTSYRAKVAFKKVNEKILWLCTHRLCKLEIYDYSKIFRIKQSNSYI